MRLRRAVIVLALLVGMAAAWMVWSRPRRVDMAAYVPADSLAYLEVNDLQSIADAITNTTSWKTLSGPANASLSLPNSRWLLRLARWTGIGSAESVLLARSQFALTVLEFDTSDAGTSLHVKVLAGLVIETHATESRMRPVLERRIEEFARRTYGQPQLSRKAIDGLDFTEWTSPDGTRRIVSAFLGSVAFVGNDEAPVQACIAVKRGARPSLAGSNLLNGMRSRVGISDPLLFGFASGLGLRSFVIATAPYAFGPATARTNASQLFANAAPKLVEGLAWAPHVVDGQFEDRYVVALTSGVAQQLHNNLVPDRPPALNAANLVPRSAYSLTQYSFRDAAGAWNDLNAAISSHVDFVTAVVAPKAFDSLLDSYGIDEPKTFLSAVGPEITTIRLDDNNSRALLIADALDAATLRTLIDRRLGPVFTKERIGDAEMMVSTDPERGAAGFLDNHVLIGSREDIYRCLRATAESNALATNDSFQRTLNLRNPSVRPTATTFTNDEHAARLFVLLFSANRTAALSSNVAALTESSKRLPYAIAVTRLNEDGFERTSRSSFGLLGTLLVLFASGGSP